MTARDEGAGTMGRGEEEGVERPEPAMERRPNALPADALRPGKWRKRPVVIDAFLLGQDPMPDWFCEKMTTNEITTHNVDGRWRGGPDYVLINTLEGQMRGEFGDWIIRGVQGEVYPCKPDIFAETYEPAGQEVTSPADGALEASSTLGTGGPIPSTPPFIQWNGGENPAPGKVAEVRYRGGAVYDGPSDTFSWALERSVYDIIAYRIIPTDAEEEG